MTSHLFDTIRHQAEHGPAFPPDMCAYDVHSVFGAPSSGNQDHDEDSDVLDVWAAAKAVDRHRVTLADLHGGLDLPRAVPFLFAGGSHGHGHIVITTGYGRGLDARVWSPDGPVIGGLPGPGQQHIPQANDNRGEGYWNHVAIGQVLAWMIEGSTLGWVETLGGKRVVFP